MQACLPEDAEAFWEINAGLLNQISYITNNLLPVFLENDILRIVQDRVFLSSMVVSGNRSKRDRSMMPLGTTTSSEEDKMGGGAHLTSPLRGHSNLNIIAELSFTDNYLLLPLSYPANRTRKEHVCLYTFCLV